MENLQMLTLRSSDCRNIPLYARVLWFIPLQIFSPLSFTFLFWVYFSVQCWTRQDSVICWRPCSLTGSTSQPRLLPSEYYLYRAKEDRESKISRLIIRPWCVYCNYCILCA